MANYLTVERALFQAIDEAGNPIGPPDYGIFASDNYEQAFTWAYRSLAELNDAIREAGGMLQLVGGFEHLNHARLGFDNYSGDAPDRDDEDDDEQPHL